MKLLPIEQRSTAWFALKRTKIGASQSPALSGDHPYSSPNRIWREIVLGETVPVTPQMQRGIDFEDEARKCFLEMMQLEMQPVVLEHETIPYMMASLDGMTQDGKIILEIKIPTDSNFEKMEQSGGPVPLYWEAQIYHQFACLPEARAAHLWVYSPKHKRGLTFGYLRDDGAIQRIEDVCIQFWDGHVVTFDPPALLEREFEQRTDIDWEVEVIKYKVCKRLIVEHEKQAKIHRDRLIEMASGKSAKGAGVKLTKFWRKGNIDYSLIPELKEMDLDDYRKPGSEQWMLTEEKE